MSIIARRLLEGIEERVNKKSQVGEKWKGTITLETKNQFFELVPDLGVGVVDTLAHLAGLTLQFQLVGIDPGTGKASQSTKKSIKWPPIILPGAPNVTCTVSFSVQEGFGEPAALLVENNYVNELLLQHVTLQSASGGALFEFPCHSWVYNLRHYNNAPRIFFANKAYLPSKTPAGLREWRVEALRQLRGESGNRNGIRAERQEADRVYDYDVYNDLGNPDSRGDLRRNVLGGSAELPYPRRCRTGRKKTRADQYSEERTNSIYVPRDEKFDNTKGVTFAVSGLKAYVPYLLPKIIRVLTDARTLLIKNSDSPKFSSFNEIFKLYSQTSEDTDSLSVNPNLLGLSESSQLLGKTIKELLGDPIGFLLKLSRPQIVQAPDSEISREWALDEEFARQTLAGINPMVIQRVRELPSGSHLASQLKGRIPDSDLTVEQAIARNRLYIVDYHDALLPFVKKANELDDSKTYASRTLFFLTTDGTLTPIAIELSVSNDDGGSRVFFPPSEGEEGWLWALVKAHATINDSAYHELISHWLRTHACMEPFIIATHRNLSALHPINVLFEPHFKDNMQINALARQILISAHNKDDPLSGIIEMGFSMDKYCMDMSSTVYGNSWRLDEEALPKDLIKRGMAVQDSSAKYNLKLYIEDYPYAVDGLEIWFAIKSWVNDYISIYYTDDGAVANDDELQNWWSEVKEKGHGDKKNESWWVEMKTKEALEEVIVTLVWIASAQHAAVNFGQYAYGGFMPNRPTRATKLIPDDGTEDYEKLLIDSSEKFYLESLATKEQATIVMATLEILSTHSSTEEYLGQRNTPHWTSNAKVLQAFKRFKKRIDEIEKNIQERNNDPKLKNRHGPVNIPYTLLIPSSSPGVTGRGIPNSISI